MNGKKKIGTGRIGDVLRNENHSDAQKWGVWVQLTNHVRGKLATSWALKSTWETRDEARTEFHRLLKLKSFISV